MRLDESGPQKSGEKHSKMMQESCIPAQFTNRKACRWKKRL
jgi:hypothetical protein